MMTKKFYIPTSTLNFNNILSSESISPKAFYAKRDFGYSRWEVIPQNPFKNAIVLHEYMARFERPKGEVEDHPLLIEVEIEESELKKSDGFYYCDHTIFFAPSTTKFIFFSDTDKKVTLSMSESSLETKLLFLYNKKISVNSDIVTTYPMLNTAEDPCTCNEIEIRNDIRINKMKGLLYGYYIGALLSTDTESVKRLNNLKEIHNIFAAILSSFEKIPTEYQDKRLDELFREYNHNNNDYQSLLSIVGDKSKVTEIMALPFVNPKGWITKEEFLYQLHHDKNNKSEENRAIIWIKDEISKAKLQNGKNIKLLSPEKGQLIVIDKNLHSIKTNQISDELAIKLCINWVNDTLSNDTNGKISTYKTDLAEKITLKAKDVMQSDWNNSTVRTYLNDLRRHIAGGDFNHTWNNGLLSSLASVLLAGDNWEKLLTFMQSKEITDYRLAYAFFGELNGYANLTRDFTDLLYTQDKNYVWNVYKEFYGQLFDKNCPDYKDSPETTKIGERNMSEIETSPDHDKRIIESLRPIFECEDYKSMPKDAQKYYYTETLKIWHGKVDINFLKQMKDLSEKCQIAKTKLKWKRCVKQINKKSSTTNVQQGSLFDTTETCPPIGNFFYCDKNIWFHIEMLITDEKAKKKIKDDLDWFQNEISSKPIGQRGYYDGIEEKDNKTVIEKFCNLKKGKNDKGQEKAPYFTEELRHKIKQKLFELYHIN